MLKFTISQQELAVVMIDWDSLKLWQKGMLLCTELSEARRRIHDQIVRNGVATTEDTQVCHKACESFYAMFLGLEEAGHSPYPSINPAAATGAIERALAVSAGLPMPKLQFLKSDGMPLVVFRLEQKGLLKILTSPRSTNESGSGRDLEDVPLTSVETHARVCWLLSFLKTLTMWGRHTNET